MIIKKFQASTETDAIILAKEELGKDAIVMNIKKISPGGIKRFFTKPVVEITAVVDEAKSYGGPASKAEERREFQKRIEPKEQALEEKLNNIQVLIEKQLEQDEKAKIEEEIMLKLEEEKRNEQLQKQEQKKSSMYIDLVKKQLIKNEVEEVYIDTIIHEVNKSLNHDATIDNVLTSIYQKIILKLGQPSLIDPEHKKYVFFMGPTGVGKTTTIAKLASDLKINKNMNVALMTSDTYRIAAVEQLRIYANILKIPLKVVYTPEDMKQGIEEFSKYDVVLIDTAGRSHKNVQQAKELREFINVVDKEQRDQYLVLSATTKYFDLKNIVKAYKDIEGYKLLFTKLDETCAIGNILNIRLLTNAQLSYTAYGQDVPKDINVVDSQNIARQLLGGEI